MKRILIIIGVIVAVLLLIGLLMPSVVEVQRSAEINAPVSVIFDQVIDLEKNTNWSPWFEKDPDMVIEYGDLSSGQGASYSWKGNKEVGSGTMTVEEVRENEFVQNEIDMNEMGTMKGIWNFEALDDEKVKVTWGLKKELSWPIQRLMYPFFDAMVGGDFERGLEKLKLVAEALPVPVTYDVIEEDIHEITYIAVHDSVSMMEMKAGMTKAFDEITTYMFDRDMDIRSYPIGVFHQWNPEEGYCVFDAGIPVLAGTEIEAVDRVKLKVIPGGPAAKVVHVGPYGNLDGAHFAIDEWIRENNREMRGAPWEVYISGPDNQQDSTKWETEIYYPIK